MSLARKLKRKGLNRSRCCNTQMLRKEGYDTDTHEFWVCLICGKEKWLERSSSERRDS